MSNKGNIQVGDPACYELQEMPDHSTSAVRATEQRLGPFIFDNQDSENQIDDSKPNSNVLHYDRKPYELDNGAIYYGEWTIDGHRDGMGTQIWKDGSKYVGYWRND